MLSFLSPSRIRLLCLLILTGLSVGAWGQEEAPSVPPAPESAATGLAEKINEAFGMVNGHLAKVLFYDMSFGALKDTDAGKFPLIVLVLLLGAILFSFRYGFIQFRLMGHSIQVIRGKYDSTEDHGEITHFQALTSALSATVGLGNIAGVAVAISLGGAGAVFWMWMVAFFGMASKFSSCTLAQMYRRIGADTRRGGDHIEGGPMVYLEEGLTERLSSLGGAARVIGKIFGISFAIFAVFGSLGGGNMFQANQTFEIFNYVVMGGTASDAAGWGIGLGMAAVVGLVVVGGIRRIGEVTSKLVPAMCVFYVLVCMVIILSNGKEIPGLIASIFKEAWNFKAAGWAGVGSLMVIGVTRGAFSNEAGLGSAAIAHSAAKTNEPVREGLVAMVGPFIDTIIICTITALTILITQAHVPDDAISAVSGSLKGAAITAKAFGSLHAFLPYMLCVAVLVFAYSTMISWYYYGERAIEYLFGRNGILPFRAVYILAIVVAPILTLGNVIDFTDLLILSMAYPNVIGMLILSPVVVKAAKDYANRLKSGEIQPVVKS